MISIEDLASFCKKKGFVYPSQEIYGGMSGSFDFGPLGTELKNNIKKEWWKTFVQSREDMYGIDGSLISSSKVWEASGHLSNFADFLTKCDKCGKDHRADHLIEDKLKISVDGLPADSLNKLIKDNDIKCPLCKGNLKEIKSFNLMFPLSVGADSKTDTKAYLRGETAQMIFVAFKNVADSSRVKLPFGIAQSGKAFRNEISPRDFLFRVREFEQMEIEYFIHPSEKKCPLLNKEHTDIEFLFLSAESQDKKGKEEKLTVSALLKGKKLGEWHAYWLSESYLWYTNLGIDPKNLRIREHVKSELSHYSSATFDIEYKFPFGWKEIHGNANRGQFDLTQHHKASGKSQELFDEESKEKVIPRVIEPSFGVERAFLAFLYDSYNDDKERGNIVLKLSPKLAPTEVAVFPLVNKLHEKAREVFSKLNDEFVTTYDKSGSIGRRYARADESGIPYCITIDFDTENDHCVTLRDRNSTKQKRVKIDDLNNEIYKLLKGKFTF